MILRRIAGGFALLVPVVVLASCNKGPITETVSCGGSQSLTYTKRVFDVKSGAAIEAGGDCKVTLTDCTIKAETGIHAGGGAHVVLVGGSLEGTPTAIEAGGSASILVQGTTVKGKVSKGGDATVTGIVGDNAPPASDPDETAFKKGGCDGYLECYDKAQAYGQVSGRVIAQIGPDGAATSAKYDQGTASEPVQKCLVEVGRQKRIAGYKGAPGELRCEYAGTYMQGTKMMSYDPSFRRVSAAVPPAATGTETPAASATGSSRPSPSAKLAPPKPASTAKKK